MTGWWAASYVVLWLLVVALALVVVALARQIGTLHLRLGPRGPLEMDAEGPALGSAAPRIETTDIEGEPVRIGFPGRAQLLLFVSPGCHICEQVTPSLAAVRDLEPLVVADADAEETALVYRPKRLPAPVVPGAAVAQAYEIPGTPFVVAIAPDGTVRAKGTVNNLEQIEGLIDTYKRREGVGSAA